MKEVTTVKIPVQPQNVDLFMRWCKHYDMLVEHKKRDGDYYTVSTTNPIDLYWLGANIMAMPATSSLTTHKPS